MSSWLRFTVRASNHSFRVPHAGNEEKYNPILQSSLYEDFTYVDINHMRLVQGPRSWGKVIPKGLAE
jgi:hypothetical protein